MGFKFVSFDEGMKALKVCLQNRDPDGVFQAMVDIENAVSRVYRQMAEANLRTDKAKEDARLVAKQNANAKIFFSKHDQLLEHQGVVSLLMLIEAHDPQMLCEAIGGKIVDELMRLFKEKQEQGAA